MAERWQVLIVEDDPNSTDVVEDALRFFCNAEVRCAINGREALDVLTDYHPTVIVMDLSMPEMDGWQALDAIRHNPDTANLPVIAITAYHSTKVEMDAERAGFNGYIRKPIDVFSFGQRVEKMIAP
jgi:two-component system, cell cycle response regulator DivK